MKSIYNSQNAKEKVIALYDKQMDELNIEYNDIFIETSLGRTHLIECGNLDESPLLIFHGGNATSAYTLKSCDFLVPHFHIYAVDTIGHPGKSDETSLSPYNQDYGLWAKEVIEGLGYNEMACLGGSFGGGILVKLMCIAPEMVTKSVLIVPSAIKNSPTIKSINMAFPMFMYKITNNEKWFLKCILPMAINEDNITKDILDTARCSIDNAKIKKVMPQNEKEDDLKKYKNPVLVIVAEYDCLFPAKKIIPVVKRVWKQSKTHILKGQGHIHKLNTEEKEMIITELKE